MRGGLRLPTLVIAIGLLAGCSDPAGAARKERATVRKKSPSPRLAVSTPAKPHRRTLTWWQAPGTTKATRTLRVRTAVLRDGRVRIKVTDRGSHTTRLLTATTRPHGAIVGHIALTNIRVVTKSGRAMVGFHYHRR